MKPVLNITIVGQNIQSFHFFGVLGYTLGIVLGVVLATQLNLLPKIVLLMAGFGAVIFFGLTFLSKWITSGETIVYYHHEIIIMVLCTVTLNFLKVPILPYLDIAILGIGTFLAFGRIGCYSVGCCHGRPHRHGVKYGQQHVDAGFTWYYKDIPLLPVQLIESVYVFATVIAGVILLLNHVAPGTVLVCYTVIYGLMRYILEFFRGDPERPSWCGLSEAQWTTLALVAITFIMSIIGWLPQYVWHLTILIIISLVSIITILYHRTKAKYILFSPPHVKQLAEGLGALEIMNSTTSPGNDKAINIYTTKAGICFSCSYLSDNDKEIMQYTVSMKNVSLRNTGLVKKLAQLIGILRNHSAGFEIIEKQNGIYHILFINT